MSRAAELINVELRAHAVQVSDWAYREAAEYLHDWAERFIDRFGLEIPTPAIGFKPLRRCYGTYLFDRNAFGLAHEIVVGTRHLADPLPEQLNTLLHELLHEWECVHFPGMGGRWNYHSARFRKKAAELGLIVDEWGRGNNVTEGPFTALLAEYCITTQTVVPFSIPAPEPKQTTRLRRWSCGCTVIRAAGEVRLQCLRCSKPLCRS